MQNQDFSYLYTEEERARFDWCRREQGSWNYRPLISIVVPVYKTPVRLLDEMIGSAIRQSYPQWELCIANASPEDRQLCEALAAWQREDGRIHVQELAENGGISANTKACFAMVQGEYTAMLDHDDMLTENALRLAITHYNHSRGVEKTSIHLFRHTFARKYLVDCGGNVFTLQKLLGHATLKMTKHYCNIYDADIAKSFDRFSPLAQMNVNAERIAKLSARR